MHDGYPHFEWVKGEPIIDDMDENFDVNHPAVDVLNEEHTIKEEINDDSIGEKEEEDII